MTTTIGDAPAVPMSKIWRTIRDFILWSYERGTLQYDVMVTLILLFVFSFALTGSTSTINRWNAIRIQPG